MHRQLSTVQKCITLLNPIIPPLLFHRPIYQYHMAYLMDSKNDDIFVKIDRRAFHLYMDSLIKVEEKFNQKIFMLVMIDCVRTKQNYQNFQQLTEYGIRRIDQFKEVLSIISFSTQLYLYNYPNRELCYKVAKKGFELLEKSPNIRFSSFYLIKFLIFIEKCVGLEKFPDSSYSLINFYKFKSLFLCFLLQMFYENKLQNYPTAQKILDIFTSNTNIVPFSDIHHYKMAARTVYNPRFRDFVNKVQKNIMTNGITNFSKNEGDFQANNNPKQNSSQDQQVKKSIDQCNAKDQSSSPIHLTEYESSYPQKRMYEKQVERRFTQFAQYSFKQGEKITWSYQQRKEVQQTN